MNVYSKIELRSKHGSKHLIKAIRQFCDEHADWTFDEAQSRAYSKNLLDGIGCIIVYRAHRAKPGLAFYETRPGYWRLANIVPSRVNSIPTSEYNQIAEEFYTSVRQWNRNARSGLRLTKSKVDLELKDIITAQIPLRLFQIFLNNYPLSHHPKDVNRLDRFICGVSRFSRKLIAWNHLGQYLKEKQHWPAQSVDWCLERIQTGLEIITVYKKFH